MIVLLLALTGASLATWFATRPEVGANETGSGAAASDEGADEQADGEDPASEGDEGADDERRSRSRGRPSVDVDGRRVLHRLAGFAAVGFAVVTVAYTAAMSFTVVPVQQVGIPVTFGTPGSPMNNGIHPKLPWTTVTLMDGTVQIDDNLGDRRTEIRLGNQSIAYVQNNVRWRIRPEAADRLFRDHQTFERIGTALEEPELAAALNAALQDYNPLGTVTGSEKTRDEIATEVRARLNDKLGDRLLIESVTIPVINFDQETQDRINRYQTEIGNTRIAEQRKLTAAAEAAANSILAKSVSDQPNVLVSRCLDTLNEMVSRGQAIPVGFSCWPGGSNAGGVIVDNTTGTTAK